MFIIKPYAYVCIINEVDYHIISFAYKTKKIQYANQLDKINIYTATTTRRPKPASTCQGTQRRWFIKIQMSHLRQTICWQMNFVVWWKTFSPLIGLNIYSKFLLCCQTHLTVSKQRWVTVQVTGSSYKPTFIGLFKNEKK